jgi:UDPglucose 6-dehydrogenase
MRIAVVGTGYVGLVAAACFAETGNKVWGIDNDQRKLTALTAGRMPIYEPGLQELVSRNRGEGRLLFTHDLAEAVRDALVVFIAVGTPEGENGSADLHYVLEVARDIGRAMNGYKVVVDKSTVPVGTAERVRDAIREVTSHPFSAVSNPEFLKQGAAVADFLKPDRVVVGTSDAHAAELMQELYAPFTRTGAPIIITDAASAEMCKYTANALLACRISFMNEVANLCELVGADVEQVRRAVGADRRIGSSFLFPGIGYGGSCFPKDVKAMLRFAGEKGYDFGLLRATEQVNQQQRLRFVERMEKHFGSLDGRTIAVWGLTFKPRTDDMREAPAITVVEELLAKGARVQAFDPQGRETARRLFGDRITLAERSYDALAGADALAVITEWNEFREPDFEMMKSLLRGPVIFDGRNIYRPEQMATLGFVYYGIGRQTRQAEVA